MPVRTSAPMVQASSSASAEATNVMTTANTADPTDSGFTSLARSSPGASRYSAIAAPPPSAEAKPAQKTRRVP